MPVNNSKSFYYVIKLLVFNFFDVMVSKSSVLDIIRTTAVIYTYYSRIIHYSMFSTFATYKGLKSTEANYF